MRTRHPLLLLPLLTLPLLGCASSGAQTNPTAVPATPAAAPAATLPVAANAQRYLLSWDGQLTGTAVRRLSCQHASCTFRTDAQVPGLATLTEESRFQWRHDRVVFQRYQRDLQLLLFPQSVSIVREADGQFVTQRKGKTRRYPGQDDAVDLLGLEVQLRADRLAGKTPKASYALAEVKGITPVSLTRRDNVTLTLNGKAWGTEVYERRDGQRLTTLWLAPDLGFVPVQIVHQDGPETYRMIWQGTAD